MTTSRSNRWRDDEVESLRHCARAGLGADRTAARLGRSVLAVRAKALRLKIHIDGLNRGRWTSAEVKVLSDGIDARACAKSIARQLNRSVSSVLAMATRRRLYWRGPLRRSAVRRPWSAADDEQIIAGTRARESAQETGARINRSAGAVRVRRYQLRLIDRLRFLDEDRK